MKAPENELRRWVREGCFDQKEAIHTLLCERARQDEKWRPIENFDPRSPYEWLATLAEEQGELAEAILLRDDNKIREGAKQVAAVALAILESQQRRPFAERSYDPTC